MPKLITDPRAADGNSAAERAHDRYVSPGQIQRIAQRRKDIAEEIMRDPERGAHLIDWLIDGHLSDEQASDLFDYIVKGDVENLGRALINYTQTAMQRWVNQQTEARAQEEGI